MTIHQERTVALTNDQAVRLVREHGYTKAIVHWSGGHDEGGPDEVVLCHPDGTSIQVDGRPWPYEANPDAKPDPTRPYGTWSMEKQTHVDPHGVPIERPRALTAGEGLGAKLGSLAWGYNGLNGPHMSGTFVVDVASGTVVESASRDGGDYDDEGYSYDDEG